ncbi:MAG: M20/M25/M40 family metallo-hydrolase, partial [Candidatus Thorarchaeota archaeon]
IAELEKLVRIPSVAATGEGLDESARLVEKMLRDAGLSTRLHRTSGAPVVTGELDVGAGKTLLIYDHYDVHPPDPVDLWTSPPFELTRMNDRLYGRGVADNKGDLVSRVWALRAYRDLGIAPPVNVRFVVEGEEETSSPHLNEFMRDNVDFIRADGGIWEFGSTNARGRQEMWLGLKGILYVQLEVKTLAHDAHSSLACVLPSAPHRLVSALSSMRDSSGRVLIDGFYDDIRPLTRLERDLIERVSFDEEQLREFYGVAEFLGGLSGSDLKEAFYNAPTCNICGVWSGYQGTGSKTVLPASAAAKLDFRLVSGMSPAKTLERIRRHLDRNGHDDIRIAWHEGYPAAKTRPDHPFVEVVRKATTMAFGHEPIVHPTHPGSGPLYLFADYVPMVSVGCGNFGSRVHSPNENITVDDFLRSMKRTVYVIESMSMMDISRA